VNESLKSRLLTFMNKLQLIKAHYIERLIKVPQGNEKEFLCELTLIKIKIC